MDKQQKAMQVFDTLIQNPARTPLSMLYDPDEWKLILVDHQASFGVEEDGIEKGGQTHLNNAGVTTGEVWRTALLELDDDSLRKNLGDVLDKNRLAALAKRRDELARQQHLD
jgi:hypothetical protein